MTATNIQVLPVNSQKRLGAFDTLQGALHSAAVDEFLIGSRP